ncbi:MAG TPA: protease inhibitor I9 family protein, partial [Amycolatopsis sp.]|nr:protease inhibitor I9 family protein [Amycolatopsis sp.]
MRRSFAVVVLLVAGMVVAAPAASADSAQQPVIVVLADQHDDVPATAAGIPRRLGLTKADQQPLVALARDAGAQNLKQFSVINGFAASMSPAAQDRLAADPRVRAVVPDRMNKRPSPVQQRGTGAAAPGQRVCPADPA